MEIAGAHKSRPAPVGPILIGGAQPVHILEEMIRLAR